MPIIIVYNACAHFPYRIGPTEMVKIDWIPEKLKEPRPLPTPSLLRVHPSGSGWNVAW